MIRLPMPSFPSSRTLLAPALAALLAAGAANPAPARAQDASPDPSMSAREAVYLDYYRAVAAQERCRKVNLTQDAHAAIARYVERQGASKIGTRRLMLIQQAKKDIRAAGCDSALAAEALARFDKELQPQIP